MGKLFKTYILITAFPILLLIFSGCAPVEYEVTIEVDPGEAGEVEGSGTYEEGEEVAVEAKPAEGFDFKAWELEGEKVSTEKSYSFKSEQDRELTAHFKKVFSRETVNDWEVITKEVTACDLEPLAEAESAGIDNLTPGYYGNNYFITFHGEEAPYRQMAIWEKESLEKIDLIDITANSGTWVEDHLLLTRDQRAYCYHVTTGGAKQIADFDLQDYRWDLPAGTEMEEKNSQISFYDKEKGQANIPLNLSMVDNYIFLYPEYSWVIRFAEVPRLEEPFLKVLQFDNGEVQIVEEDLFDHSLLITDIVPYKEEKVIVASADEGFYLIDPDDDFSLEHLEAGGRYQDYSDMEEQYDYIAANPYISHRIHGANLEGIIQVSSRVPVPYAGGGPSSVELWAPKEEALEITAQTIISGYGPLRTNGDFEEEPRDRKVLSRLPGQEELEENLWAQHVLRDHLEKEDIDTPMDSEGISGFYSLKSDKILTDAGTRNTGLYPYLEKELSLENILKQTQTEYLPEIVMRKDIYRDEAPLHYQWLNDDRPLVFAAVEENTIRLVEISGDVEIGKVDKQNSEVYLKAEDKVYLLDYEELFQFPE